MRSNLATALIAALCGCVASCATHLPQKQSLSGKYQSIDAQADSQLSLEVRQQDQSAALSFSAGNTSGRGTAPDGTGEGQIASDGSLHFQFEDSFGNKGNGVFKTAGAQYLLTLNATSVTEPRALTHYGARILQKKSASSTAH